MDEMTVLLKIISLLLISISYLKENYTKLKKISLAIPILILSFGFLNPFSMDLGLNILGLTERLVIFALEIFIFFLSYAYTFNVKINFN